MSIFRQWRLNLTLLSICSLASSATCAQIFSADFSSSEWKSASDPFFCSLTHPIPGFGQAVFSRKSGTAESLIIESKGRVDFPVGAVAIETLPPVWRNDIFPVRLGGVTAVAGYQPIILGADQIPAVVGQLSTGVKVMFTSQPAAASGTSVGGGVMRVVLEAKNFAPAYKTYQECLNELIPYSFAQVARTFINYAEKPDGLSASNKTDLSKVARYVKADPKVLGVFVDGHSDNLRLAEGNEAISKQVAEWVAAYLVEQGVPAEKITTRWHSDKFPIADNKLPAGRAQNRRVTVRLEDEAARKETEKKEAEKKAEEEKAAAEKKANAESASKGSSSSSGKMTPEEINRMVEGLDLINGK